MSRSSDVRLAQSYLDRLAGRRLVQSSFGPELQLQLDFGPPGFPQLAITTDVTITQSGHATTDDVVSQFVMAGVPGVSQAVDVTVADDGELTVRFAEEVTLTVPPDAHYQAWELRDETGVLLACPPGGGLAIGAPDQPDLAEAFTLDGRDGVKWIIGPLFDPYRSDRGHARHRASRGRRAQGGGHLRRSRVEIRASGLVAHTTATLAGDGPWNLAEFIADLAANWRGWAGERRWRALEGEMEIEASHDGRAHVLIAVTIRRPQVTVTNDAWSARVVFTLEAGEQLTSVARDLASVLDA